MDLEQLIRTWGYAALFIGTFLEGETILVLGGFAAHRGLLRLDLVMLAAFAGSLLGDQLFFHLGRRYARPFLARRPGWELRAARARALVDRHRTLVLLTFRFLYGLRTVTPFVLGTTTITTRRFLLFNAAGALLWAVAVATGGYYFGKAIGLLLEDLHRYQFAAMGAIALIGAVAWGVLLLRRRRRGPGAE